MPLLSLHQAMVIRRDWGSSANRLWDSRAEGSDGVKQTSHTPFRSAKISTEDNEGNEGLIDSQGGPLIGIPYRGLLRIGPGMASWLSLL
jgi:hypothetical protein